MANVYTDHQSAGSWVLHHYKSRGPVVSLHSKLHKLGCRAHLWRGAFSDGPMVTRTRHLLRRRLRLRAQTLLPEAGLPTKHGHKLRAVLCCQLSSGLQLGL